MVSEKKGTEMLAPEHGTLEQSAWPQPVQALAKVSATQGTSRTSPYPDKEELQILDAVLLDFRPWLQPKRVLYNMEPLYQADRMGDGYLMVLMPTEVCHSKPFIIADLI